jgi:hypothetical protein
LLDGLFEHFFVLDVEIAADRVVVKGAGLARGDDVEACDVPTRIAAVAAGPGPETRSCGLRASDSASFKSGAHIVDHED